MFRVIFLIACIPIFCISSIVSAAKITSTPQQHRLVLLTGCGRSATAYMNEFLRASGLDVHHEQMGSAGSVSWLMAANVDWAPWGPLAKDFQFDHIFHQIRDPLKVIQSFYNVPPRATWEWINHVIPKILISDNDLTKCAKYWYYWNLMAEEKAEWSFRIEDFDTAYVEMGRRLGITLDGDILKSIPKTTNTKGPPTRVISWKILAEELDPKLFKKIRKLAIRYGYTPKI